MIRPRQELLRRINTATHGTETLVALRGHLLELAADGTDFQPLDADLKHLLAFLESPAGKRYVSAYIASLGAGYDAMGRRCGEQLGESLRELAQAQ